jgi:hypothetical protein
VLGVNSCKCILYARVAHEWASPQIWRRDKLWVWAHTPESMLLALHVVVNTAAYELCRRHVNLSARGAATLCIHVLA